MTNLLKLKLGSIALLLFLIGVPGAAAQGSRTIYITDGDSQVMQSIDLDTGAINYTVPTFDLAYPIAVRDTIYLSHRDNISPNSAVEYQKSNGDPTGNSAALAGPNLNELLDGTTDGTFNYSVSDDTQQGDVYRFNGDWTNPVLLFEDSMGDVGITYDSATGHLWMSDDSGNIYEYDLAGNLQSQFSGTSGGGLAYEAATDTLWVVPNNSTAPLENYSKGGTLLGTRSTPERTGNAWGAEICPGNPDPALVYDCTLTGKFKYSWVDDDVEGDALCLFGQGLSTRVNLKAFYVQGTLQPDHECEVSGAESSSGICDDCEPVNEHRDPAEACAVKIIYGECQTSEGIQKFFWFSSGQGNPTSPDFCNLNVEDCLNQIDSVCDGITLKGDQMTMKLTKGSESPVYGTKLYRNLFKYTDNFDECDECPPWQICDTLEQTVDDCIYECEQNSIEVTAIDIAGALSKCTISTTRVPTTMPFNYLNFCDHQEDPQTKVSEDICAPKSLCGPFYSYWASLDGRSYYPSPYDICINNDLTIEGSSERGNPGYLFASIEACAKYRLNTSMTACANLLADVCKIGDSGDEGYGFLNHESHENPVADECGCTVRQGTLNYGVLCVALYLESKGYEFNRYGTENVIRKGVGLPPKDN